MGNSMAEEFGKVVSSGKVLKAPPIVTAFKEAEDAIRAKFDAIGGEAAVGPRTEHGLGQIWRFAGSAIVYDADTAKAYWILGEIYKKWNDLGGLSFGTPCTDELTTRDGAGRYTDLLGGGASIYFHPDTGAHLVYGAIKQRWMDLGAERSYLGYPVSDEVDFPGEGRANDFQHGGIYHWADTGPIDLRDVIVHYTGLHCFGESDWDQADFFTNSADEPYLIFGLSNGKWADSKSSRTYSDVDAGEDRPDLLELYRGRPYGLNIGLVLMEHDTGDPNKYREQINGFLMSAHATGTAALGIIPIVGIPIAAAVGPVLGALMPELGQAINDAFDWGDDTIGTSKITLSARDLVLLAGRTENSQAGPIGYKVESPLISGEGASYKAYFGVVPVTD